MSPTETLSNGHVVSFYGVAASLKGIPRSGWVKRNISKPESVGDHTYSMLMLWNLLVERKEFSLDKVSDEKCRDMILFHDIGERFTGDITPSDGISKDDKYKREELSVRYISIKNENPRILELWSEFEAGKTKEAQLVFDLDRLDCISQLFQYERKNSEIKDQKMFESEFKRISTPEVQAMAKELKEKREAFFESRSAKYTIIFVIGPPGVGKSTQCTQLAQELRLHYISAGDILREERDRKDSPYSQLIADHMAIPWPVPAELTVELLCRKLEKSGRTKFLIDGFPRSLQQALEFDQMIQGQNYTLMMDCDPEILLQRLADRAVTSGRTDDAPEVRARRVATFSEQNSEVEKHLANQGRFHRVDAGDKRVFEAMKDIVSGILSEKSMSSDIS